MISVYLTSVAECFSYKSRWCWIDLVWSIESRVLWANRSLRYTRTVVMILATCLKRMASVICIQTLSIRVKI